MNPLALLRGRFAEALKPLADDVQPLVEMVLPSKNAQKNSVGGDYQANCAMPLGKKLGKPPREVAAEIVAALKVEDFCETPEVAGPGFINLRLKDDWLVESLAAASADSERLGIAPVDCPRTYVLDYSSPNVAKPMHVGHIRSTVIGDALYKTLGFLGHRVISDNHIGDWGTQFGMIIYGYKHFADEAALAKAPVAELSRLYKLVNQIGDYQSAVAEKQPAMQLKITEQEVALEDLKAEPEPSDPKQAKKAAKQVRKLEGTLATLKAEAQALSNKISAFEADSELEKLSEDHPHIGAKALAETAKLHEGDAENVALWERFLPACLEEIDATYQRLGVTFDYTLGESFYHSRLGSVVEDLQAKGLAKESDGAICVFVEGYDAPMIVRKKDGAFLYATTDLATIQYRQEEFQPDAILYVVDHRQSLHFEHLIATADTLREAWGLGDMEFEHVSFGTVLGEDNKPYKTRSGSAVGLVGLLDEAVERAYAIAEKSPVLTSDEERKAVAERIGIGAIKYADLAHNRTSDYVFSYDKMLAMSGNTAAYMQNSYARVRGIFGKAGTTPEEVRNSAAAISLATPAERALALSLLQFAESLDRVANDYRPNHLAAYLFDLASRFSTFFEQCPVNKAETEALKQSRLVLCDLVARTIGKGLELLGIETVERM